MDRKVPQLDASMLERLNTLFVAALGGRTDEATAEEMLALTAHALHSLGDTKPAIVRIARGMQVYRNRATVLPFRRP